MQAIIHLCFCTVVIDLLCTFTTANWHSNIQAIFACILHISVCFTPSCRYIVVQVTFACVLHIWLIHVHCTSSYMYATCLVVKISLLLPPFLIQAVFILLLCLFSHTSYFLFIIITELEEKMLWCHLSCF